MLHNVDLILTLAGGLTAALALGFVTQKLRMSPLVGYLLAGIIVGPYSPGFVADADTASQCAEIGIILLMFGVGLHFHLKDLLAVQRIVLPGAAVQIAAATLLGMVVSHGFGWSWTAGAVFGMAISVASTVVLTRVLSDNKTLHTTTGPVALGWLVVEDLFTILLLVLLPAAVGGGHAESVWRILGVTTLKLAALVVFTLVVGQRIIPKLLAYVARTGTRDLFTLAVLVLALGVAVGSATFFGASMALGAFLGGMVVGQSEFSARAAAEALPMRDAFAVLFFVSVGMLFNPASLIDDWPLILATLAIVLLGKPLAAFIVVKLFRKPLRMALSVAVALAQIGEFSFILASLGISLGVLPPEASSAIIVTAILSITLNPLIYRRINAVAHWLEAKGIGLPHLDETELVHPEGAQRIIVVGYGPVGKQLSGILRDNNLDVVIVEMNIDTVRRVGALGEKIIYGDATQREVLIHAGAEEAEGLIISSASAPAEEIVEVARSVNPDMRILVHTTYLSVAETLKAEGASAVFSGEREVAVAMTEYLMRDFGATDEQIDKERRKLRESMA